MTSETTYRSESITRAVRRATADRLPPLRIEVERTGPIDVRSVEVDGHGGRAFLVVERATGVSVLVDPTGDRARVLELVYDAQDAAEDAGEPAPAVGVIALPRPAGEAAHADADAGEPAAASDDGRPGRDLVTRLARRLGAPVLARGEAPATRDDDAARADEDGDVAPAAHPLPGSGLNVRLLALRGGDPQGGIVAVEASGAPAQLFVGDALGESGPKRLGRDRAAAMRFVMDLERNLLAPHGDDAVVRPRGAGATTIGDLREQTTAWRRGFGLPASTAASPVWFTDGGRMLRLRRMHADPAHAEHRFVMLMIGATVHAAFDPDEPLTFLPAFGVYPPIAAFLGLSGAGVSDADRSPRRVLHLGAGALAVPRMISAARPGSRHEVVDIEPAVFAFARAHLPLRDPTAITEHVADARDAVARFVSRRLRGESGGFDAVVTDVFDGLTVPPHLSTVEAFAGVRDCLEAGGVALVNLPADPGSDSARVVVAAMREVFAHVAVAGPVDVAEGRAAGNVIAAGSDAPIDVAGTARSLRDEHAPGVPHVVLGGAALDAWIGAVRADRDGD